ncbi:MAG: hypothetical protein LCH82_12925 [Actinobacteria bacterium]|nr:hypothetical protein [Actinomycetota bacterium]
MVVPLVVPDRYGAVLADVPECARRRVHRHHMSPYVRIPNGGTEISRCSCGFALPVTPGDGPAPAMPTWQELLAAADRCPERCRTAAQLMRALAGMAFAA